MGHVKFHPFSIHNLLAPVLCFLFLTALPVRGEEGKDSSRELVFFNWSAEYINQDVVREFEEKFHATVKQVFFETGEVRNEILSFSDGKGYDVTVVERHRIASYAKKNWIYPLNSLEIPNFKHIDKKWVYFDEAGKYYAIPYTWGTIGIAYRKDLVKEPVTSWKQLFHPPEEMQHKILMIKDSIDTIGAALKSLGYSVNSNDPKELKEAGKLLFAQRPFVKSYSTLDVRKESQLVSGELVAAMAWNGDALLLHRIEPQIEYVIPEEGSSIWVDSLVIMSSSRKKELAAAFINFLNEPRNAARITEATLFATPNKAALPYLSREILDNKTIFPSEETLAKAEFNEEIPSKTMRIRNNIFSWFLHN